MRTGGCGVHKNHILIHAQPNQHIAHDDSFRRGFIAALPAAALLNANEKLKDLFVKGKKKGRLEPAELSEVVDAMDLDGDQMDSIYDSLADLGIDIES